MKTATSICFCLIAALLMVLSSGGIAAAQFYDTNYGFGTLANNTGDYNSAFGFDALNQNTSGSYNTATGMQALLNNTTGSNNTATGVNTLTTNSTGHYNTASGVGSLFSNTSGSYNTATGASALATNTTGVQNTATGVLALSNNSTGNNDTAFGYGSLEFNGTGVNDTATGGLALAHNTTGSNNTATGFQSLKTNSTGSNNTGIGLNALYHNTTGIDNSAVGLQSLINNTSGYYNTGIGVNALYSNTTGIRNTSLGLGSLYKNTSGQNNIGIGVNGGYNPTTGSNNIEVGNVGLTADANTIRLGTQGTQTATYIAGITNSAVSGADVMISSAGRLGLVVSSARYKKDISDMGNSTDALMKLRPVTFRYKSDQQGVRQYGLIAEEVDHVYPELVFHDADGKVESVRYSMLTSMLLNELQKQTRKNEHQAERIARLEANREQDLLAAHERELAMRTSFEVRFAQLERTIRAESGRSKLQAASNK